REKEARHAEEASSLGRFPDGLELAPASALQERVEPGDIRAGALQHILERCGILDVELALPEPFKDRVIVGAVSALPPGMEQPDAGQRRIPDLLRAADGESDPVRLPAHIHVAVPDAAPLVGVAVLLQDAALAVDLGAPQIG